MSPFDFEKLVPYAIFGVVAALAWFLMDAFSNNRSRSLARLRELKNPQRNPSMPRDRRRRGRMSEVIEMATPTLAKPLEPKTELEASRLKLRLMNAGFRGEDAPRVFLSIKFSSLIMGSILGGAVLLLTQGFNLNAFLYSCGIGGLFFYLPELILTIMIKRRQGEIFLGLPDALDLMVVCVEAGLGLDQAMRKVAEEMVKSFPVVAQEFGLANMQLQMGRPRNEVLHELGVRTGVSDVRSLVAVLIQADKFGASIAHALRVQSDAMRTRRRQIAEEKAAKTAVKLIFPLVLFIFPGIFVILVGPAAIKIMEGLGD